MEKGAESLFECLGLKSLGINNYKGRDSTVFSRLKNLEKLTILNSDIENLIGLSSLTNLNYLSLTNVKNLTSLKALGNLKNLRELNIHNCKKINTITKLFNLKRLEKLSLLNLSDITTIKGIENLSELKILMFYESTNIIDGDLSPLFKLKNLSNISFQNRKHYTNRREDFSQYNK